MKQSFEAVYEGGVFRPLKTPSIPEGKRIRLTLDDDAGEDSEDLLELAAEVYEGFSDEEIKEIEHLATRDDDFFGARDSG